jgi:hypothetical protein
LKPTRGPPLATGGGVVWEGGQWGLLIMHNGWLQGRTQAERPATNRQAYWPSRRLLQHGSHLAANAVPKLLRAWVEVGCPYELQRRQRYAFENLQVVRENPRVLNGQRLRLQQGAWAAGIISCHCHAATGPVVVSWSLEAPQPINGEDAPTVPAAAATGAASRCTTHQGCCCGLLGAGAWKRLEPVEGRAAYSRPLAWRVQGIARRPAIEVNGAEPRS